MFDFNMDNLDDPKKQALLMLAAGLLTPQQGKGMTGFANSLGQGIQHGLLGYNAASQNQRRNKLTDMQLAKEKIGLDYQQGTNDLAKQYFQQPTPDVAYNDALGEGNPGMIQGQPGKQDFQGFINALPSLGGQGAKESIGMMQAMGKDSNFAKVNPHDYTPESVAKFQLSERVGKPDFSILVPVRKSEFINTGSGHVPVNPYAPNLQPIASDLTPGQRLDALFKNAELGQTQGNNALKRAEFTDSTGKQAPGPGPGISIPGMQFGGYGNTPPQASAAPAQRPPVAPQPQVVPTPQPVVDNAMAGPGVAPKDIRTNTLKTMEEYGKAGVDRTMKQYDMAQTSMETLPKLHSVLDILNKGDVTTGIGAEIINNINRVRSNFLADKEAGKSVTDTQVLDAMLGADVFPMIQSLGIGARGMDTPAERDYIRSVMTGTKELDKNTLIRMTEIRAAIQERAIQKFNDRFDKGELKPFFSGAGITPEKFQIPQRESASQGAGVKNVTAIVKAKQAIAQGAPREAVIQRLREQGYDTGGL